MLIRPMSEGDVAAVVDLTLANYDGVLAKHHTAGILAGFRADITPQFFREQLAWKQVFAVEEAGEVVATGALADFGTPDEPRYTVSQFYVCSDLHGRGIGRRLLEHLVATTRELGVDSLHVPSRRNAIPFYRHAGFSVDVLQPDAATEITWMTMPLYGRPEVQAVPPVSDGRAAQVDDERTAHGVPLETTVRAFRAADLEPVEALIHTTIDASYTAPIHPVPYASSRTTTRLIVFWSAKPRVRSWSRSATVISSPPGQSSATASSRSSSILSSSAAVSEHGSWMPSKELLAPPDN